MIATQKGLNVALKTQIPHLAHPGPGPEAHLLSESAETMKTSLFARENQGKVIT